MNQIILFIVLYFSITIIYDYKYDQKNNNNILIYHIANILLYINCRNMYINNESKIMSLLLLSESNFYNFMSLYVLLNIFIEFLQNKNMIFYLLIIVYYQSITILMHIIFFYMLYKKLILPSILILIKTIKNNLILDDNNKIFLQNNIKLIMITYVIEIALIFTRYIFYKIFSHYDFIAEDLSPLQMNDEKT